MQDTRVPEVAGQTPHTEPTRRDRNEQNRTIVARWNIGDRNEDGGQRQARFEVCYWKGHGYHATLTTVVETDMTYGRSEVFQSSMMKFDEVHKAPASRYSKTGLTAAYEAAVEILRARFDRSEPTIVRHFDHEAPMPRD